MSVSSEPFTIALAALEPTAQAIYTILDRQTTPTPEVRKALLNPPEFYFKIFFLSRMLEVRFPVPPPPNDSILPTLVKRVSSPLKSRLLPSSPINLRTMNPFSHTKEVECSISRKFPMALLLSWQCSLKN